MCVCVCLYLHRCACSCHSTHVEVRGQVSGRSWFSLSMQVVGEWTQMVRLAGMSLYPKAVSPALPYNIYTFSTSISIFPGISSSLSVQIIPSRQTVWLHSDAFVGNSGKILVGSSWNRNSGTQLWHSLPGISKRASESLRVLQTHLHFSAPLLKTRKDLNNLQLYTCSLHGNHTLTLQCCWGPRGATWSAENGVGLGSRW